jgi:hypothetical protein
VSTIYPVGYKDPTLTQSDYTTAVQLHLDANAQRLGYDGILSASSYAGDSNPTFASQGATLKKWRSDVWAACYAILAQVQAATLAAPTIKELIVMLPTCPL